MISLGKVRAEKHEDATKWNPREAVAEALDRLSRENHSELMIVMRKDNIVTTISSGVTVGTAVELLRSALNQMIT